MATKTGIGRLKHKLSGLRRNSAKVLKKTNTLVSGAIGQLKRAENNKPASKSSAPRSTTPVRRQVSGTAKPAKPSVKAARPAKQTKPTAPSRKKVRTTAVPAVPPQPAVAIVPPRIAVAVPKAIRAAAAAAASPVKTAVAPLHQRVGSVLDFQLPTMPSLRRLAPMKPSPDSRASRATSKGKHAALSAGKAAAIQDAGAVVPEGTKDAV